MSANLPTYPRKPFELADDLDSFVHIILWSALCFHPHTMSDSLVGLENLVASLYTSFEVCDDTVYGPLQKFYAMKSGHISFGVDSNTCPNLRHVIDALMALCKPHYALRRYHLSTLCLLYVLG